MNALRSSTALFAVAVGLTACSPAAADSAGAVSDAPPRAGVSLPSYHYDVGDVEEWEEEVGTRADVVQTFVSWRYDDDDDDQEFPARRVGKLADEGRTVEITWVPEEPTSGDDQPRFDLAGIADGDHDAYVRQFAEDVAESGAEVRLRFAHEMNGTWQSFNESNGDNEEGDFVDAWRHVHDVVEDAGADVTWVWAPNVATPGTTDLAGLYPGDEYVDVIGIDGYSYPAADCVGPEELFDDTLAQVRALSDRPVEIAEVGVDKKCPDRAQWVADLFTWVEANDVQGVTWWERKVRQGDYRLEGDDAAVAELRRGLAG